MQLGIEKTQNALSRLFLNHRIVFWYDDKIECEGLFDQIELAGIIKKRISGNEFALKHHVLRECPDKKFLLYHRGPRPQNIDNWLLDVLLTHTEFRTDQASIWLDELGLDSTFASVALENAQFFTEPKRIAALKKLGVDKVKSILDLQLKMLAVCVGVEPKIDIIVQNLLNQHADNQNAVFELIKHCALDQPLYQLLKQNYGYESNTLGIRDFVITLFSSCLDNALEKTGKLNQDAIVLFKQWRDNKNSQEQFKKLSDEISKILGVENIIRSESYKRLAPIDYFEVIESKIIKSLIEEVTKKTILTTECLDIIRLRLNGFIFRDSYRYIYQAIEAGCQFIAMLDAAELHISDMEDGVSRYTKTWFKSDQLYRQFVYCVNKAQQPTMTQEIFNTVENLYTNKYLLALNDRWQEVLDKPNKWASGTIKTQRQFYQSHVATEYLTKNKKVYVIISDAFRYEIGDELCSKINQDNRFEAQIKPMLTLLPSTTAMGMAALLPNKEIGFSEDAGDVLVDGQSTLGTANRQKVLMCGGNTEAKAMAAKELMDYNKEASRALIRDNSVVYIYHNHIDSVGDKRDTEHRVFDAVDETLGEIINIVKKLTNANATNIIVTADHGFIYQHQATDETSFVDTEISGEKILKEDRRYVLGRGLQEQKGLKIYQSEKLGLTGNLEIQVPRSINRLRQKGSGSRYVHGGASLQEVVVPVVSINKKRQDDVEQVEVEIIRGTSSLITSGQLAVVFYQAEAVTDKIQPRELRAGIYSLTGTLLSDQHNLKFDSISELGRERESQVRFMMTKEANSFNNQEVVLKLEEQEKGTSHYREYKSIRYTVRRSITSDFDF